MITGILQRATDAKTKSDEAQIRESIQLAYHSALAKDITGENGELTMETLQGELDNEFTGKTVTITPSTDKKEWTIEVDGVEVTVVAGKSSAMAEVKDKNGTVISATNETSPFLPDPTNNEIINNDLNTGLTIKDSNQNEWVWIIVPKTSEVYVKTGMEVTEYTDAIYTNIENDLRNYCKTDKSGSSLITVGTSSGSDKTTTKGYTDSYVAGRGTNITSATIYKQYKQRMLKSVYENGGFYIGRYETGTETERGSKTDSLTTAKIQQNLYPYNYITNKQAEDLSEELKTGDKTSTLMFGIQWDLVLKHLSNLGVDTTELTSNSNWGNYYDKQFKIDRGRYSIIDPWNQFILYTNITENKVTYANNISRKVGTTSENKILLTTGASDNNSKFNIYDLAGNVSEWTLEKTSYTNYPCAVRGSAFNADGSTHPVSMRTTSDASSSGSLIGFRVSLY